MAKQYNVNIIGNLTNNNGVLSGFSAGNYATIPLNFNPVQRPYEVVFKFSGTNGVIWNVGDLTTPRGHVDFEIYQNKLYAEFSANTTLIWSIEGVTTLSPNTNYWAKLAYNGVDRYSLYLSTDGTTWNTEGTTTSSNFLSDGSTQYNLIGCQTDNGVITYSFDGSIDLNGCYINVDGATWWRGTENVTKIQLRHDTATNWTSVNPILLEGEVGIETDTRKQKFGDGVTAWNSLPYDVGSTALQSITSSNVTNALGYTPVNKSGDTMTGTLSISKDNETVINLTNTAVYSTATSAGSKYVDIRFLDYTDTRRHTIRSGIFYDSSGNLTSTLLTIGTNGLNGSAPTGITIECNSSGTYCTFPKTTCVDGQWTTTSVQLANNVNLPVGNDQEITYDLSSAIPNDNYKYEVVLNYGVQTGNSSGAGLSANIIGSGDSIWHRICDTYARGSWYMNAGGNVVVTVGTARTVTFKYTAVSKAGQLNYLYVEGYKRKGTNS